LSVFDAATFGNATSSLGGGMAAKLLTPILWFAQAFHTSLSTLLGRIILRHFKS
jgi:hypothetical protein